MVSRDRSTFPRKRFIGRCSVAVEWVFIRLRWLQHGRVHIYILYLGVTIIALLTWYLSNLHDRLAAAF